MLGAPRIALEKARVEPVAIGESSGTGVWSYSGDSGNLSTLQLPDAPTGAAPAGQRCEVPTLSALLHRHRLPRARLLQTVTAARGSRAARHASALPGPCM